MDDQEKPADGEDQDKPSMLDMQTECNELSKQAYEKIVAYFEERNDLAMVGLFKHLCEMLMVKIEANLIGFTDENWIEYKGLAILIRSNLAKQERERVMKEARVKAGRRAWANRVK